MTFDRLIDYLAVVGVKKPNGNSKQVPVLLHRYVVLTAYVLTANTDFIFQFKLWLFGQRLLN